MRFLLAIIFILTLTGCKTISSVPSYNTIALPAGGVYHYVKGGETLWSISRLYNVDINTLVRTNNLEDTHDIRRAQRLFIPGVTRREEAPHEYFAKESFIWPLKGSVISYFGSKAGLVKNKGIDISAFEGASVKASKAGRVVFCDDWLKGFGKTIILDHDNNFQTVYAYNSALLVRLGDFVEQNTVIARTGRSGRANGPSLHFEIRRDGQPQNPFYYLSR